MREEAAKRMEKLGIPPEAIQEYLNNGTPYCTGENGEKIELSKDDEINLERVKSMDCETYFISKRSIDGIPMNSYIVVSDEEEDYEYEFYDTAVPNCYGAFAFVTSELTHGSFDGGCVSLRTENGRVYRLSGTEVQAIMS